MRLTTNDAGLGAVFSGPLFPTFSARSGKTRHHMQVDETTKPALASSQTRPAL